MSAAGRITATLWDCGGVFLNNGWDHVERRQVVEHFGLSFDEFERRHAQPNDEWERGRITIGEYLQRTVFYVPRSFSQDEFISRMRGMSRVLNPEMIRFVSRLRAECKRPGIYLLSNESRELMSYRIPQFGLRGIFDAYVVSAYIGVRKPDPQFFLRALELSQREPGECVFVDDREENVAAAEALGIHGIRMNEPRQVIAALSKFGLAA